MSVRIDSSLRVNEHIRQIVEEAKAKIGSAPPEKKRAYSLCDNFFVQVMQRYKKPLKSAVISHCLLTQLKIEPLVYQDLQVRKNFFTSLDLSHQDRFNLGFENWPKAINFSDSEIDDDQIIEYIYRLPNMEILNLRNTTVNGLCTDNVERLVDKTVATILNVCTRLKIFNVNFCVQISDAAFTSQSVKAPLVELHACETNLTRSAFNCLAEKSQLKSSLRTLNISKCRNLTKALRQPVRIRQHS
jgi:hypothetical protein